MTISAWIMLAVTWTVIAAFAGRFFWKVLTLPPQPVDPADAPTPRDSK